MVFGAIDIGSNAVRLLFCNVFEEERKTLFKKSSLIRVPIRLGEDAFLQGHISAEKKDDLLKAMRAFSQLIDIHRPVELAACATSAMRNADNCHEIVETIHRETGIRINVIDGKREAEIIYSNHIAEEMESGRNYLYIEVGGGSVELTLFSENERIFSRSFPMGTLRLLNNLVEEGEWKKLKKWLKSRCADYQPLVAIGSGGNINFIFKQLHRKEGKPISYKAIKKQHFFLKSHSYEERVKVLGLRPDRADVVIPAGELYLSVMKWTGIETMYVPKIGLADGLIRLLYDRYRFEKVVGNYDSSDNGSLLPGNLLQETGTPAPRKDE